MQCAAAAIVTSSDGRYVFVSVRGLQSGPNCISRFACVRSDSGSSLRFLGTCPSLGACPRGMVRAHPPHLQPPHLQPPHLQPPHLQPLQLQPPHLQPPHLQPPHSHPPAADSSALPLTLFQAMSPSADVLYPSPFPHCIFVTFCACTARTKTATPSSRSRCPPALQPQHAAACAVARRLRMRPLANALRDGRSPATASWNL